MNFIGTGLVLLAAILWGLSGGIGSILMDKGWDPLLVSFYRGAVGLLCILFWLSLNFKKNFQVTRPLVLWSILAGIGVAGNFAFYFFSISLSGVAVASTLMYTAPLFVLLISFLLRTEQITLFKGVSIAVVMAGISLLTNVYEVGVGNLNSIGIITGLLAGISYAIFIFGFKYASAHGRPQTILTIAFFVFSVLLVFLIDGEQLVSVFYSDDLFLFVVLGVVGAGLSFFLYIKGVKIVSPSVASVVAMIEPVTASLFGVLILGEFLSFTQTIGMAIILITITLLSTRKS
ncbi:DMT family transporter [Salipaludibacillus sp. CUR1]|uniref:DMT family transporter n=1 Tax=Salipaludibacillus sp. CUR1 TaxID=2820003 RepID=UPI001E586EB3|nr:DMT family transporter [Salipaludibacillus sp. CUR1]MCE7791386.1 DMT family transporter [Salipaludibacillus sp. CUR1]